MKEEDPDVARQPSEGHAMPLRRRDFVALVAAALASRPVIALAQVSPHHPLIGILLGGSPATVQRWLGGFPEGLQGLGYLEHRDYEIEYRYADGDLSRLRALAAELILVKPDVIVVGNTAAALAVKRVAANMPVVIAAATNPIGFGLAASHARPGGNVTGMLAGFEGLASKQLELGLELVPGGQRVGMLVNIANVTSDIHWQGAEAAAKARAASVVPVAVRVPTDLDAAIHDLARERVDFIIVPVDAMFLSERRRIAELAVGVKLPAVYGLREHVEDGGLISYGVDLHDQFRRSAGYVDNILRGAKPAELPFEQPTKFELTINLKTARALGLAVPPSLLARADEVIE
jgi:putative ABC transport system substrate-binding protein